MSVPVTLTPPWLWSDAAGRVEVRFAGRGPFANRVEVARAAGGPGPLAWSRQVHSTRVLPAADGACGEGDALVSARPGLALSMATADCVPLLLGSDTEVAAVHAGWRGIAAGVVAATLARLRSDRSALTAWLGPAIGPCCYEVGNDVAADVAAASDPRVVVDSGGPLPHLDLLTAVEAQLERCDVGRIRRLGPCTRCEPGRLWSYRGQGSRAGRNYSFIWLRDTAAG